MTAPKIVVHVEREIEDLIPQFMENRRRDVTALLEWIERGDYEAMKRLGHTLKGMGGGFGFDGITDLGRAIESAANAGDSDELRRQTDALRSYLDRVEIVFDGEA